MKPLPPLSRLLLLATSALVPAWANADDWAYPEGATSKDAAVLTAPTEACLAEISKQLVDLERKLQPSEVDPKWFTASPYVNGQTGDRKFAFHLSYDDYDRTCRVVDRRVGLVRKLPACQCAYIDPGRAAAPKGEHAGFLQANGRLKAIEDACAASPTPQAGAVAEYRRTLNSYFTFKTKVPELIKNPTHDQRRDAWEFGKALGALERNEFDDKTYRDALNSFNAPSPGRDAMCAGASQMLAEKTAGIVWEVKAFERRYNVKVELPAAPSTGSR